MEAPNEEIYKLKTDAAIRTEDNEVGIGAIVRNNNEGQILWRVKCLNSYQESGRLTWLS